MVHNTGMTRRDALRKAAATAGLLAVPCLIPASALGLGAVASPSDRIRYGYIGCGNHGAGWNFDQVFRCPGAQIVAVCDVDQDHLNAAKTKVDSQYGSQIGKGYQGCEAYGDFRDLINRKDIDAVGIATPDHWHVIPAIMAAKAGKDVICEKPLTITVAEGRVLSDVMKQTGRVFQTASENRSVDVYIRLVELVRSGVVGKLKHIEVRLPVGNNNSRVGGEAKGLFKLDAPQEPPKSLNYEMWLGQAPWMPYIPARLHGNYRWNLAFSGGVICDWGAHLVDLAQWGHDTEHTGPVAVEGKGDFPPRDAIHNTAPTFEVRYRYADNVTLTVSAGHGDLPPQTDDRGPVVGRTSQPGIRFEGDGGWIESHGWRGGLRASRPDMLGVAVDRNKLKLNLPAEIEGPQDGGKGGEHPNFIECVKSRKPCYAPAETGHRTISIPHIGNIAMQLGRALKWNPDVERFVGDAEADAMLSRRQREPWTIGNIDSWIRSHQ